MGSLDSRHALLDLSRTSESERGSIDTDLLHVPACHDDPWGTRAGRRAIQPGWCVIAAGVAKIRLHDLQPLPSRQNVPGSYGLCRETAMRERDYVQASLPQDPRAGSKDLHRTRQVLN